MSFPPGSRLGPYEVTARIGEGGMGAVYRARDTRLNRDVALKVLLPEVATDPERLARFRREAQTLAALNHPHIAQIHGLEEQAGSPALVMECVDGEDLARRLERGPVPIDEALSIARQIAEALEAAHEQGIIHRDLKPGNIKVKGDGTVKVLDFGLAKALDQNEGDGPSRRLANSPTITSPAMTRLRQGYGEAGTEVGMILGTAAYMSPEQAKGRAADRRADIWAWGCLLYELLTGAKAFDGEDITDVLGSIVKSDPDWSKLPAGTPLPIAVLLKRCLRKGRSQRLDSATAIRIEIDDCRAAPVSRPDSRSFGPGAYVVASLLGLLALAGAWTAGWRTAGANRAVSDSVVAQIPPPPGVISAFYDGFALSPDAATLAFVARDARGGRQLWLRTMASGVAQQLAGTEDAHYPFWSPDGRHIGFFSGEKLRRVPVAGGTSQVLADISGLAFTGSWSTRDDIAFGEIYANQIQVVSASGGTAPQASVRGATPHWLPGGAEFLIAAHQDGKTVLGLVRRASTSPEFTSVIIAASYGNLPAYAYSPAGFLFMNRSGALTAQRFDPATRGAAGPAFVVAGSAGSPRGWFAVSAAGDSVVALAKGSADEPGDPGDPEARLIWVNRRGDEVGVVTANGRYWAMNLAPDGERIYAQQGEESEVLGGRGRMRLGTLNATNAVWSPDGSEIASVEFGTGRLLRRSVIADRPPVPIADVDRYGLATDWSPDGNTMLIATGSVLDATVGAVAVFDFRTRQLRQLTTSRGRQRQGRYSFDGKWVAFTSNSSGRDEVYVVKADGSGTAMQVSEGGGHHPMWRRDGRELFFLGQGEAMFAVPVSQASLVPSFEKPVRLFQRPLNDILSDVNAPYAVAADGQRFLLNVPGAPSSLLYIRGFDRLAR